VEADAVWTLAELQDLLDEWVVAGWQDRPHDGLRNPRTPGLALSPNEMYAALVSIVGYVPVVLSGDDYIELLPVAWRAVNDDGITIGHRNYDSTELGPYRRRPSPMAAKRGLWEVHYDPYDLSRVWVRCPEGGFLTATWTYLASVGAPFADFTWRQARRIAAARGEDPSNQAALARILDELLHRAHAGPGPADRATVRALARERSAASLPLRQAAEPPHQQADGKDADVIPLVPTGGDEGALVPFGVFDPDAGGDYG
jgi:putative transposase